MSGRTCQPGACAWTARAGRQQLRRGRLSSFPCWCPGTAPQPPSRACALPHRRCSCQALQAAPTAPGCCSRAGAGTQHPPGAPLTAEPPAAALAQPAASPLAPAAAAALALAGSKPRGSATLFGGGLSAVGFGLCAARAAELRMAAGEPWDGPPLLCAASPVPRAAGADAALGRPLPAAARQAWLCVYQNAAPAPPGLPSSGCIQTFR